MTMNLVHIPENGVIIRSVMAGESWTDPNGASRIAADDLILFDQYVGHQYAAVYMMGVDSAMATAILLNNEAVKLMHRQVGDDGKPVPLTERLRRINAAHNVAHNNRPEA